MTYAGSIGHVTDDVTCVNNNNNNLYQAGFAFPSFTTFTSTVPPDVSLCRSARTHKPKNFGPDLVT